MKKISFALSALVLVLGFASITAFNYQGKLVKDGKLIVLNKAEGVFEDGLIFVNRMDNTIISKASLFPVTLWEDRDGNVHCRRDMLAYRAYVVADIPATENQIAFFRKHFPKT
jgi:hypothetical protein